MCSVMYTTVWEHYYVSHAEDLSEGCLSPWWGSNLACVPRPWGHTSRAPCGLHEREYHSRRTTKWRTARWSARSEWTAGKRTKRCRWVLRGEKEVLKGKASIWTTIIKSENDRSLLEFCFWISMCLQQRSAVLVVSRFNQTLRFGKY